MNEPNQIQQSEFEEISAIVYGEFQVDEALLEHGVPTYYLTQPQETKQAFLRLLKKLEGKNLMPILRRNDGKVVLKVVSKPATKPTNTMVNWILFFVTIFTTFYTGYIYTESLYKSYKISFGFTPVIGGVTFAASIMIVLGIHEMGHKIAANKNRIEATFPYFIPGPPPIDGMLGIGTFGAVIMQKSLPPNKDALFDVGASGPVLGFIASVAASILGIPLSRYVVVPKTQVGLPTPLLFILLERLIPPSSPIPPVGSGEVVGLALHPVAFAGWVGIIVTMLNLLPAAMLDGGHIAKSLLNEKMRMILTALSIILLVIENFWPMALFILFLSMYRHPGPLDGVSSLSRSRKIFVVGLLIIFVLCFFI